jgi:hypothetical protein
MAVVLAASLIAIALVGFSSSQEPQFQVPTDPLAMVDDNQRIGYATPEVRVLAASAVSKITYPWQETLENWTVQFVPGEGKVAGFTWSSERHIEVFVRPGDDADSLARVFAHELGHAVDVTLNSGDDRRDWLQQRGITDGTWWPGGGQADFASGAGDFAEAFAYWQLRDTDIRSEVAGTPTSADLALMIKLSRD